MRCPKSCTSSSWLDSTRTVDQLILEFARKGYEDLEVIQRFGWDRALGLGVVEVKPSRSSPRNSPRRASIGRWIPSRPIS
jgi:hypothetical protein